MNIFQRIRRFIIIKTAESYYDRMSSQCEKLYKETKKHHYIIIDPWMAKKIVIINRDEFRRNKRVINDSGMRMSARSGKSPMLTHSSMPEVHEGCFYSSMLRCRLDELMRNPIANDKEIRRLTNDIEARRIAYIRWAVDHAKFRERKNKGNLSWKERRMVKAGLKRRKNQK